MLSSSVRSFLESAYGRRDEIVPLLVGEPGIGKTQGVYDFARSKGVKVVELYLSQMSPLEISGMTMPNESDCSMQVFDSKRLDSLEDGDVLFLDELLQAPQQVLAACLTLIQERRMLSGRQLPDVFIVAAANPIPDMGDRIPASIRQRFMAVHVRFDETAWIRWMWGQGFAVVKDDLLIVKRSNCGDLKFNDVTPRTFTKLCRWCSEADDLTVVKNAIYDMYDSLVEETVFRVVFRSMRKEPMQLMRAIVDAQDLVFRDGTCEPIDPGTIQTLHATFDQAMTELETHEDIDRGMNLALRCIFKNMQDMPREFIDAMKHIDLGQDLMEEAMLMKKKEKSTDETV